MYRQKRAGASKGAGILNALQAMEMIDTKSKLPAEIMNAVLEYLPVPDQLRVARTSRRLQEMVYDDTKWVSRLKAMRCWDEREARHRFEESIRRRREANQRASGPARQSNGSATGQAQTTTLFDALAEEQPPKRPTSELRDGFETLNIGRGDSSFNDKSSNEPDAYLTVFSNVKSIRGRARQEYGKVYSALATFYFDIIKAKSHADPIVFKAFRDPEQQAQMLANLLRFAKSDWSSGCDAREQKLGNMVGLFENAVLREFDQGYEQWDVDGRMRRYAHVLHTLNGARGGVDLFIQRHPIFSDHELAMSPLDCLDRNSVDEVSLEPSRRFLQVLLAKINDQADIIARVFPNANAVYWELVEKVREDVIMEYTTTLFDRSHERSIAPYLKAISGVFEQSMRFFQSLAPPQAMDGTEDDIMTKATELSLRVFEPHLDLYLQEELDFFTKRAETEVSQWEKKLSEEDLSLESFYMANVNRSAEKSDFLSSFKKVVMMPVTVLAPTGSSSATAKHTMANGSATLTSASSRPGTPGLNGRASPMPGKAPTDELAAKAALMASKLEGIKSLCSIEVALNLVHLAKTSLGRAAVLIPLGGQFGGEAKEQCSSIFVVLLRILGQRHVKSGFETAVNHLSHYNPRQASTHHHKGVAPLVTFIELVNVGDLISQMIEVFYEQQLAAPKIADKNDFLDPAALAKKKFEQMLDESVAAGLNKGIDVLMNEVEFLCSTTQLPTDFNPRPVSTVSAPTASVTSGGSGPAEADIGPTTTAKRIVDLVSSHTDMLIGTTDKAMLDVFNGEVGLRLFTAICKHLKRQRISTEGAIKLIADMNLYAEYIRTLKHQDLIAYFSALRELSQIYLIDQTHAKDMASVIADGDRFGGVFRAEEVYEYAQRRADWYQVKRSVERAMYGKDCVLM